MGERRRAKVDPERIRHKVSWDSGRIPLAIRGKFRQDDVRPQRQAHQLEQQQALAYGKDSGGEPSPFRVYLVPGRMLEPGSQNVQPGQRTH